MLTVDEVGALVPALRTEGVAGASYCGEDGYFDRPQAVVVAFAEAARARGARFEQAEVISIGRDGGGWRLETAAGPAPPVERLVVAAAAETARLVAPLEHRLCRSPASRAFSSSASRPASACSIRS